MYDLKNSAFPQRFRNFSMEAEIPHKKSNFI